MRDKYFTHPTEPIEIFSGINCSELLERLEKCSFQGRQLALAAKIWSDALDEDIRVWFGLATFLRLLVIIII